MKKFLKVTLGVLVALVVAGWLWWSFFRVSAEQRAKEEAAGAILEDDGQVDGELGDLEADMKGLGVDPTDEAEADKLLDDIDGLLDD